MTDSDIEEMKKFILGNYAQFLYYANAGMFPVHSMDILDVNGKYMYMVLEVCFKTNARRRFLHMGLFFRDSCTSFTQLFCLS